MAGNKAADRDSAAAGQDTEQNFDFDLADMDLAAAAARGAELELHHPVTGVPLGIYLIVCGSDSQTYQDSLRRITEQAQRDGLKKVDAAVYERRASQMCASLILDWSYSRRSASDPDKSEVVKGVIPWHKNELPFSEENAVNVFLQRRWIREQVEAFANVRANFFRD